MASSLSAFVALLYIFNAGIYFADATNPCFQAYHKQFPLNNIGSRNEKCKPAAPHHEVCDHYLPEDWYRVDGSEILDHCPVSGDCGVLYPIWMKGQFPSVSEGIVNRTACMKSGKDCCKDQLQIRIKNCTKHFVYHLEQPKTCPTAYCFISDQPCKQPNISSTTVSATSAPKRETIACDSKCILIIIAVGVGIVLVFTIVIVGVMCKKEICFKKRRVCSTKDDVLDLPPSYEFATESKK